MSPDLRDFLDLTISHLIFLGKHQEAKVIRKLIDDSYARDICSIADLFE